MDKFKKATQPLFIIEILCFFLAILLPPTWTEKQEFKLGNDVGNGRVLTMINGNLALEWEDQYTIIYEGSEFTVPFRGKVESVVYQKCDDCEQIPSSVFIGKYTLTIFVVEWCLWTFVAMTLTLLALWIAGKVR